VRALAAGAKAMIPTPISVRQLFATRARLDDNRWFIQASSLSDERSRRFILVAFATNWPDDVRPPARFECRGSLPLCRHGRNTGVPQSRFRELR
jgi:hypothetical protein